MQEERLKLTQRIFEQAVLLTSDRGAFLDRACGDDAELRREVESLLRHHEGAPASFMEDAGSAAALASTVERAATPDPLVGSRLGDFTIKSHIASGGMGVLYLAVQGRPRRRAALKVMKQGIASRSALRRFEFESQTLARLRHPNIAHVYDAGTHDTDHGPVPYFAMEYVANAKPITEYADAKKLGTRERLALFRKVCDAVHHGHQKGIIHRDVKPANILVDSSGEPKIIDFGVARATDSDLAVTTLQTDLGQLIGTLQYMSPEQCDADPDDLDTRSDVYALGVVMYELLCGRLPYDLSRAAVHEAARVIQEQQPPKLSTIDRALRGDVETISLRTLEKDRRRRYGSASELADDIRRYLNYEPIVAHPPSVVYQLHMFARRHSLAFGAVAAVAAVLVLATVVSTLFAIEASAKRDAATAARDAATSAEAAEARARAEAEQARDRADRRFRQVRELARVFMFDFNNLLHPLDGALPARQLLVATALEYLEVLAQEAGDDPELRRELATAYHRIGDLQGGRRGPSVGNTQEALASYRVALDLRQELATAGPNEPGLRMELAESHQDIGTMLKNTGDLEGALASCRAALDIWTTLVEADPEDVKRRRGHGVALNGVGDCLLRTGERASALGHYEQALVIWRTLTHERPDEKNLQRDLASTCNRVAYLLIESGATERGLQIYEEEEEIRRRLAESDPTSARWRFDLARNRRELGRALLEVNRIQEALGALQRSLEPARQLARDNPAVARYRAFLAALLDDIGQARLAIGDVAGAMDHSREAVDLLSPLVEAGPEDTLYRRLMGHAYEHMAEARAAAGDPHGAVADADRAIELFRAIAGADKHDAHARENLARSLATSGRVLVRAGCLEAARTRLEEACAISLPEESSAAALPALRALEADLLREGEPSR